MKETLHTIFTFIFLSSAPAFCVWLIGQGFFIAHYGVFMLNPMDWPNIGKGLLWVVWSAWNMFLFGSVIFKKEFP